MKKKNENEYNLTFYLTIFYRWYFNFDFDYN